MSNEAQEARRHLTAVISRRRVRDLLRKTVWVSCIRCELRVGPLPLGLALIARKDYDGRRCLGGVS